jgi:hypothetical protein
LKGASGRLFFVPIPDWIEQVSVHTMKKGLRILRCEGLLFISLFSR